MRAGAIDGDGSAERPFGTLHAALATVAPEGTVALGPGRYVAPTLTGALTLQGRCARDVVLEGVLTATPSAAITLLDLSVEGAIDVVADAQATPARVQVANGTDLPALRVEGAARANALRVMGPGEGVRVVAGGRLDCADCVVHGTTDTGVRIEAQAEATLEDTIVVGVTLGGERPFRGSVHVAGKLVARGLTVLGGGLNRAVVAVRVSGGEATLDEVRVASVGIGLYAERGGSLSVTNLAASPVGCSGVQAQDGGMARGARWRIEGRGDATCGGITTFAGGRVDAEQVDIRFAAQALFLAGPSSAASLRNARLESSRQLDLTVDGADLELERVRIVEVSPVVIGRDPTETRIRFEDVELMGAGLTVWRADAHLARVSIDHPSRTASV